VFVVLARCWMTSSLSRRLSSGLSIRLSTGIQLHLLKFIGSCCVVSRWWWVAQCCVASFLLEIAAVRLALARYTTLGDRGLGS